MKMISANSKIFVTLTGQGSPIKTKALLDSGNNTDCGVVISEKIHNELKASFVKLGGRVLSAGNQRLKVKGVSTPIKLKFKEKTYIVKPIVIIGLNDPVNLGRNFMKKFGIGLKFGPDVMESSEGSIQMVKSMKEVEKPSRGRTRSRKEGAKVREERTLPKAVLAKETTLVPPNCLYFVKIDKMEGERLIEPLRDDEMQAPPAVYNDAEKVAVLNLASEFRIIKAGEQIGESYACQVGTVESIQEIKDEEDSNEEAQAGNTETKEQEKKQQFQKLLEELGIAENEILRNNPGIRQRLVEMLERYQEVFSSPERSIGRTNLVEFVVRTVPGARPVKERIRPLNPMMRASLKAQLDEWKKEGVIEEISSPWAAAMVPCAKSDGGIRWAVDYRPLNKVTIVDAYPLPSIEENLQKLSGSCVFSTLDATSAYQTIPVEKKSRPFLAFVSCFGTYTFKRMPFGPTNSGATYTRFVDTMVDKLRSPYVVAYVDDVIVHTPSLEQHLVVLEKTLAAHVECGIKLKAAKSKLFRPDVNYLGYEVSEKGISMRRDYVEKILNWPIPKNSKELRSLLGFLSYYRSFVPNYAMLAAQLNAQRMAKKFEWTKEMGVGLEALKEEFRKDRVRAYPRWDIEEPFVVTTDFSAEAIAVVVSQKQEGVEKFIAAAGRKCTKYEQNYPSVKGELAAIVYALRKFEHLLRFRKFLLHTDSAALRYLKTMKLSRGIWFRWLAEVQSYQFDVVHRAGRLIPHVDGLSRSGHLPPPEEEETQEQEEFIQSIEETEYIVELEEVLCPEGLIQAQRNDKNIGQVLTWLAEKKCMTKAELKEIQDKELRTYAHNLGSLVVEGETLYQKYTPNRPMDKQRLRAVVPEELRDQVFYFCHVHPASGHFGQTGTSTRAAMRFWWPGMGAELRRRVDKCQECLAKTRKVNAKDAKHEPVQNSNRPGEKLYIDLVGPLPVTPTGTYKYVMTMQDSFTRYVMATPLRNKEAETCAEALIDRWVGPFGCPESIHSDQGREFVNKLWDDLCKGLEIRRTKTPPYSPQSNSVERFHRTLNQLFRIYLDRDDPEWYHVLPMCVLAYNSKVNGATGVTPMEAWTGREATLPIDLVLPQPERPDQNENEQAEVTRRRFRLLYEYMRKQQGAQIRRNAAAYTGRGSIFTCGDWVWYFSTRRGTKPKKIVNQWVGPYVVKRELNAVLVEITPALYTGRSLVAHITRLRLYTTPRGEGAGNVPEDMEDLVALADEEAEELEASMDSNEAAVPVKVATPEIEIQDLPSLKKKRGRPPTARNSAAQTEEPEIGGAAENTGARARPRPVARRAIPNIGPEIVQTGTSKRNRDDTSESERERPQKRDKDDLSDESSESEMDYKEMLKRKASFKKSLIDLSKKVRLFKKRERPELSSSEEKPKEKKEREMTFADYDIESTDESISCIIEISQQSDVPVRGSNNSAAYDVCAESNIKLAPGRVTKIPLKLTVAIPTTHFMWLAGRSGLAAKGIMTHNGIIDPDYRGQIAVLMYNTTGREIPISKGQRVAQVIILPVIAVHWKKTDILPTTERDVEGFGSTGLA